MKRNRALSAVAIIPNRQLAREFSQTVVRTSGFELIADMEKYPQPRTLSARLAQWQPEAVFLEVGSDLEQGLELIRHIAASRPAVQVVGLHTDNEPGVILRTLRAGACEFLYPPFDGELTRAAADRIGQLVRLEGHEEPHAGKVAGFVAAKPGAGASTLAAQTAFVLGNQLGKRVLLADFDLWTGTIGFLFRLNGQATMMDALRNSDDLDLNLWNSLVTDAGGIDVLAAPQNPQRFTPDAARLHQLLEFARATYDWIIIDLPSVFVRLSLTTIPELDNLFLVSTTELPSLHLTRKAVSLLERTGFGRSRFQVVVNRLGDTSKIHSADMAKMFGTAVHATFPNDYVSLHQALTAGRCVEPRSPLGRCVTTFAATLVQAASRDSKTTTSAITKTAARIN